MENRVNSGISIRKCTCSYVVVKENRLTQEYKQMREEITKVMTGCLWVGMIKLQQEQVTDLPEVRQGTRSVHLLTAHL